MSRERPKIQIKQRGISRVHVMRGSHYTPVLSFGRLSRQSRTDHAVFLLIIINRKRPMKQIKLRILLIGSTLTILAACSKGEQEYTCVCATYRGGIRTAEYIETIKAEDRSSAKLSCSGRSSGYVQCELQ